VGGGGEGVGNGGGGGIGRVAPRKSLGDKSAAIISRSNSSPTKICPGRAVSSGEFHCPSEEASSAGVMSGSRRRLDGFGLRTIKIFQDPVR
jgi:hypothetical protein